MKGITRRCKSKDRQFNGQKEQVQKQAMIKLYNVNIETNIMKRKLNRHSYQVIPIKCRLLSTHYLSLRHHTILNIECFNFIKGTMGILKSIPENNLMDRYLDTLVHYISVSVFSLPHKVCLHVMVLGCYKNVQLSENHHHK